MSRKTLQLRINSYYEDVVKKTVARIKLVDYVCLTADCWSTHSRAFFGVTCHWINKNFERESVVLACVRFKGTHSYDKIAEQIDAIMKKYEIQRKQVVAVVTDNGTNFCKAFKEFGINFEYSSCKFAQSEHDENPCFDSDDEEDGEDITEVNLHSLLDNKTLTLLPPHVRCSSHSLSLVATTDGLKVRN